MIEQLLKRLDPTKVFVDDEAIITREELILAREKHGRERLVQELLPAACTFLLAYVKNHGWFYPPSAEGLHDAMASLVEVKPAQDELNTRGRHGNEFLKAHFRSFWDVADGPVASLTSPDRLHRVVEYRLGLGKSKLYTYKLSDGRSVESVETFDFSLFNIRRGFVVTHSSTSFFKPVTAVQLYRRWLKDVERPVVWDPSSGFGARLLAFAATYPEGTYFGNEPAKRIFADLQSLKAQLENRNIQIERKGSELRQFPASNLDLVFTSPPYFDLEKYYDEPGQCWRDYPTMTAWVTKYLKPTLHTARQGLKQTGHLVLNVDQKRRQVALDSAVTAGFTLVHEHKLMLGNDSFSKTKTPRWEPILVFKPT